MGRAAPGVSTGDSGVGFWNLKPKVELEPIAETTVHDFQRI